MRIAMWSGRRFVYNRVKFRARPVDAMHSLASVISAPEERRKCKRYRERRINHSTRVRGSWYDCLLLIACCYTRTSNNDEMADAASSARWQDILDEDSGTDPLETRVQ